MSEPIMLAPRTFGLGAVLTVTAGSYERPLCPLGDLYAILGFLLADVPAADDLAAAITVCRPIVLAQHPELEPVTAPGPDTPDAAVLAWLADREAQFGSSLTLTSPNSYQRATTPGGPQ